MLLCTRLGCIGLLRLYLSLSLWLKGIAAVELVWVLVFLEEVFHAVLREYLVYRLHLGSCSKGSSLQVLKLLLMLYLLRLARDPQLPYLEQLTLKLLLGRLVV